MKTHAPRNIKCPGCPKAFASYSALVLHYEANTCRGNLNAQWVHDTAQSCRVGNLYWKAYTHPDYPYRCPTCGLEVRLMSALLQHVESDACAEKLWNGTLADVAYCCKQGCYPEPDDGNMYEDEPRSEPKQSYIVEYIF